MYTHTSYILFYYACTCRYAAKTVAARRISCTDARIQTGGRASTHTRTHLRREAAVRALLEESAEKAWQRLPVPGPEQQRVSRAVFRARGGITDTGAARWGYQADA